MSARNLLGRLAASSPAARSCSTRGFPDFADEIEEAVKEMIADALRGCFDEGVPARKKAARAILQCPGAKIFPEIAADLVIGPATADQAITVLARTSADAATRASAI